MSTRERYNLVNMICRLVHAGMLGDRGDGEVGVVRAGVGERTPLLVHG